MTPATPNTEVLHDIIQLFEATGILGAGESRHKRQARDFHEVVHGLNSATITDPDQIQLLFDFVITARAISLGEDKYHELSSQFDPEIVRVNTFEDAIQNLLNQSEVGQKIANEFLRLYVHVFEARPWVDQLEVPLDTHVLQALDKTGAIPSKHAVGRTRGAGASSRIAYDQLQAVLHDVAMDHGYPRIVFDELWVEHKYFLGHDSPAMRNRSRLADLIH